MQLTCKILLKIEFNSNLLLEYGCIIFQIALQHKHQTLIPLYLVTSCKEKKKKIGREGTSVVARVFYMDRGKHNFYGTINNKTIDK